MAPPRSKSALDTIADRTALWGIDTQYKDAFGQQRQADPEVVTRLLRAFAAGGEPGPRMLPRSVVLRRGGNNVVGIQGPAGLALRWEILSDKTVAAGSGSSPHLILPENLPRVLEPFFTTKPHGNGLGLPICRTILWEIGGTIGIESQPGQGTRVDLTFPQARWQSSAPTS